MRRLIITYTLLSAFLFSTVWLTKTPAGDAISIGGGANLTTKGDLAGFSTFNTRVPVGTDTHCLKADSSAALGVSYSACGSSQGLHTLYIGAGSMLPSVSAGSAPLAKIETTAGRPDLHVLDFDAATDENAQFSFAFPKSWNEGTITYRVYWTVTAAVTTDVIWGLKCVAVSNDDTINAVYGTAITITDTALNASNDEHLSATSSALTIAGTPAEGDKVYCNVYRDADAGGDTMTQDARLSGIDIFYTTNADTDA